MSARSVRKSAGKATAGKSTSKKKSAVKKRATGKKKTARKKTVARKATVTKKTATKKAAKKKIAGKKAAPEKKTPAKKAVKKKVPAKKAAPKKKTPAKRKPTARELEPFRRRLMAKQRELMQTYATFKGDSRDRMDDGTEDYIDYAVSSYAKEFMLSLTEIDRRHLRLVEQALRRIENRDYGSCQNCGTEIPRPRLEVAPWAVYCVTCQEMDEQGLLVHQPVSDDDGDESAEPEAGAEDPESEEPEVDAKAGAAAGTDLDEEEPEDED